MTVRFDRGGWLPALFADILDAGYDLLTYREGAAAATPAGAWLDAETKQIRHAIRIATLTRALRPIRTIGHGKTRGKLHVRYQEGLISRHEEG